MVLPMCKINYMLYKYISDKYNSVPNFANISGIPQSELSAFLLNEKIAREISSGIKICRKFNLDIVKLVQNGGVCEAAGSGGEDNINNIEFRERYMRLSMSEKKKVYEFMNSI